MSGLGWLWTEGLAAVDEGVVCDWDSPGSGRDLRGFWGALLSWWWAAARAVWACSGAVGWRCRGPAEESDAGQGLGHVLWHHQVIT